MSSSKFGSVSLPRKEDVIRLHGLFVVLFSEPDVTHETRTRVNGIEFSTE
jgi:hypothetical protein